MDKIGINPPPATTNPILRMWVQFLVGAIPSKPLNIVLFFRVNVSGKITPIHTIQIRFMNIFYLYCNLSVNIFKINQDTIIVS